MTINPLKSGIKVFLLLLIMFVSVLSTQPKAFAAPTPEEIEQLTNCNVSGGVIDNDIGVCVPLEQSDCANFSTTLLGIPAWYKYLQREVVSGKCRPVLNGVESATPIGLAILEMALTLAGIVAVVMVFIGGFKYVLAQGEADKAAGGRKTVINAMIGLVIIILATRVVAYVGTRLG